MGEVRWKPIVFGATVIVALILIIILVVHKSSTRSRLCENSTDLFYINDQGGTDANKNGTCYPENKQGPCPNNMILISNLTNTSLGVCDCDNLHNERHLEYHKETDQCYFIFTQGFCNFGEWIIMTKANPGPICEKNTCMSRNEDGSEWVLLDKDGSCGELGKSHKDCKEGEVIKFYKHKYYPSCNYTRKTPPKVAGVGVPPAECPSGQSRTRLGHCALDFDFD